MADLENNRAPLLCYIKPCVSFHSHWSIQTRATVRKFQIWVKINNFLSHATLKLDRWPWKTIGHIFYATSTFVHHFIAIGEFKLELHSGNDQFGSKSAIFCPVWPWKTIGHLSLLCYFKLCASSHSHWWNHTGVTIWKHPNWGKICFDLCDLDIWPLTSCIDITFVNGNNSWKFHDDTMTGTLWKRCLQWKDRRMDCSVLRAAWLQLKIYICIFYHFSTLRWCRPLKSLLVEGCAANIVNTTDAGSNVAFSSWSNMLIIGIYTAASAHRHVLKSCPNKTDIHASARRRIIQAHNWLAVVTCCDDKASANPFLMDWSWSRISMLATAVGGRRCLWDSEATGSKLTSSWWSNSLMIGIYLAANAHRQILTPPLYKYNILHYQ